MQKYDVDEMWKPRLLLKIRVGICAFNDRHAQYIKWKF